MPSRFSIGWSTVVMLVLLRVVIGWHFFSEGLAKFAKPFSSEGFLKQAKGPLADSFQSVLPDYHGWKNLHRVPAGEARVRAWPRCDSRLHRRARRYLQGRPSTWVCPAFPC